MTFTARIWGQVMISVVSVHSLGLLIRGFVVHSDTEYRPIESPVTFAEFRPIVNRVVVRQSLICWRPMHNFLLMV